MTTSQKITLTLSNDPYGQIKSTVEILEQYFKRIGKNASEIKVKLLIVSNKMNSPTVTAIRKLEKIRFHCHVTDKSRYIRCEGFTFSRLPNELS